MPGFRVRGNPNPHPLWSCDVSVPLTLTLTLTLTPTLTQVEGFRDSLVVDLLAVSAVLNGLTTGLERSTLAALITYDVHARDVAQRLADERVTHLTDFAWVRQLRFYWRAPAARDLDRLDASASEGLEGARASTPHAFVEMAQSCVPYGYDG